MQLGILGVPLNYESGHLLVNFNERFKKLTIFFFHVKLLRTSYVQRVNKSIYEKKCLNEIIDLPIPVATLIFFALFPNTNKRHSIKLDFPDPFGPTIAEKFL